MVNVAQLVEFRAVTPSCVGSSPIIHPRVKAPCIQTGLNRTSVNWE